MDARFRISRPALLVLAVLAFSCGGGGGGNGTGGVVTPPPSGIEGQWNVTYTDTSSTCDMEPPLQVGTLVSVSSGRVLAQAEGRACDPDTWGTLSGRTATYALDEVLTLEGPCRIRYQENIQVAFGQGTLSGSYTVRETYVSGDCSEVGALCRWDGTIEGQSCSGCYDGCVSGAQAPQVGGIRPSVPSARQRLERQAAQLD